MTSLISVAALLFLAILLIHHYLLHPFFISPLSRIPAAHWTAPFSPLWILLVRYKRRENRTLLDLHTRLGPLVRLGPNELSVNSVDGGIRTIYGAGWEKHAWYSVFTNYGGVGNTFCSLGRSEHSRSKRLISNAYAKSNILGGGAAISAVVNEVIRRRVLGRLAVVASEGAEGRGVMEMYDFFSGTAMDFVSAYVFGVNRGSRFLLEPEHCRKWVTDYKARQEFLFWSQELPRLTAWLARVGIRMVPKWVDTANQSIEDWVFSLCEAAERGYPGRGREADSTQAVVYNQLRANLKKSQGEGPDSPLSQQERMLIASELLDHVAAGFDTTGITLTYLAWELSKPANRGVQEALRAEIHAAGLNIGPLENGPRNDDGDTSTPVPDLRKMDGLPLLHGVVMETLRLHAAIPGGQPRLSPANAELGSGTDAVVGALPAGVRVGSAAHTLHLNEAVFPRATEWRPRRWLAADGTKDDGASEKSRWFWAFGSGGRMCVGSNLAVAEIKAVVAAVWGNFDTTVDDDCGMVKADGYTCEPLGTHDGRFLRLRVQQLSRS